MGCLGNVLWSIFRGGISGLSWLLTGCLWCNDHRDSRRATVLQICKPKLFPLWERGGIRQGRGFLSVEYHLACCFRPAPCH